MAAKKESSSKQLPTGPAGDKKAALETALAQIEKQFGKGAVMKLGTNVAMQVDAISTGSLGLDLALGIGGLPRGRIIEVYGPESSGKTTLALHVLAEAQKYLGCPYRAGGASPSGFDCSGFVYYVLKQLGLSPCRTPSDQYKMGIKVAKADLQVGDLVFFGSGSSITHAGIYAGSGQFIHAPNSRSTVSYSDLTTGYWAQTYYGACRVAQ